MPNFSALRAHVARAPPARDSFMTSPSCPVSCSLPVPYMRVASMKRISPPTLVHARPVATPGLFGALRDLARVARRAEELAELVLVVDACAACVSPSAIFTATPRMTLAICRSSVANAGFARVVVDDLLDAPRR